jgi:hypothetical protein
MTRWTIVGICLVLSACGAGSSSYEPVSQKTKYTPEDLLSASITAVEAAGHATKQIDRDKFSFETRQKEVAVSSVPRLSYKYSYRISTAGGKLTIESTCVENSSLSREKFTDCGDDRPDKVIDETKQLQQAILGQAKQAAKAPK